MSKITQYELEQLYKKLKEHREAQELSQSALADMIGVSKSSYADLEQGRSNASLARFSAALKALGLKLKICKK